MAVECRMAVEFPMAVVELPMAGEAMVAEAGITDRWPVLGITTG